jgi:CRP-like cAMP-binding protein
MSSAAGSAVPTSGLALDLTALAVFDNCPPAQLSALNPPPEELTVEPGESIVREGHLDHEWYVVIEGEASVSTRGEVLGVLGPGEHFGEIAILSREPRRFTVRALTAMRVLAFSEEAFLDLLEQCAPFGRTLLVRLTRRMSSLAGESGHRLQRADRVASERMAAVAAVLPSPHPSAPSHLEQ